MKKSLYSIPLLPKSAATDYSCPDGEIAGVIRIPASSPSPSPSSAASAALVRMRRPDPPAVSFALRRAVLDGWHIHPDIHPSQIVEKGEESAAGWGKKALALLRRLEKEGAQGNLFTGPFLVLAAWRLTDGSRVAPSLPVLMIPNSAPPLVAGTADFSVATMKMSVVAALCSLQWKLSSDIAALTGVFPEITHIDILVSPQLPLYSIDGEPGSYHRVSTPCFSHSFSSSGIAGEHRISDETFPQGWIPEAVSEAQFKTALLSADKFYPVSEIPVEDIAAGKRGEDFSGVDFNCGGLPGLTANTPYTPDFRQLAEVEGKGENLFSGRLSLWDLTLRHAPSAPLEAVAPPSDQTDYCPRWVFRPVPGARKYVFNNDGINKSFPLWRHPSLAGAYWWGGLGDMPQPIESDTDGDGESVERLPGAVWRSAKGCRMLFPDSLLMQLDVERVIYLCRAFRASGLVATTAPTAYAFTSEGVFLLKEMDDGTLRDAGLICGYVVRDAQSVTLLPTGVRFVTAEGLTVLLEGTKAKVLTAGDDLSPDNPAEGMESEEWVRGELPEDWELRPGDMAFVTRPLKLSGAEMWKRALSVALRGSFPLAVPGAAIALAAQEAAVARSDSSDSRLAIVLYGSTDLNGWHLIASREGAALSGLWAPSFRFFRLAVRLPASSIPMAIAMKIGR